jgi:TatD DNase family protein
MLVDTHIHLNSEEFTNVKQLIARSEKAGVGKIIQVSTDDASIDASIELAKKFDILKIGIGLYPDTIVQLSDSELEKLVTKIEHIAKTNDKVICISEIGLDRKYTTDEKLIEKQKIWFKRQLELAKKLNLPVQIHSRDAEEECIKILEELEVKRVQMHCFMGSEHLIKRCVRNGWYLSVPVKAIKQNKLNELIHFVPMSQMLTETDGPYLHPDFGQVNEPKNVQLTIQKIAEVKGTNEFEVENIIFQNYKRLYEVKM